ncbi:hypothetical protein BH11BAC1_BH11BAC1_22280 [soil metagenome]
MKSIPRNFRSSLCLSIFFTVLFLLSPFNKNAKAQWVQTNGPMDETNVLAIISSDTSIILATDCGYYSKNNLSDIWQLDTTLKISDYTQIGDTVLFKNDDSLSIIRLSDPLAPPVPYCSFTYQSSISHSDSCLYAGGFNFYKSNNGGITWSYHPDGLPADSIFYHGDFCCVFYYVTCIGVATNYIFCGTQEGVYRNTANVGNWSSVNTGLPPLSYVTFIKTYSDTLYTAIENVIYKSTDLGNNWNIFFNGPSRIRSFFKLNSSTFYTGTDSSGIYESVDSGSTWNAINTGLTDSTVTSISFYDSTLLCGTEKKGVFLFQSGQWIPGNNGIICSDIRSMITLDSVLISNSFQRVYISDGEHNDWRDISPSTPNTGFSSVHAMGDTIVLSVSYHISTFPYDEHYIMYSADHGNSWISLFNQPPLVDDDAYGIFCMPGRIYAYFYDKFAYYTDDLGLTWTDISFTSAGCYFTDLKVSNSKIFAGSCNNIPVLKMDNNQNWIASSNGLPANGGADRFAFCNNTMFAFIYGHGTYVSYDLGDNWFSASNGYPSYFTFTDYEEYNSSLLVGTDNGVGVTSDSGQTWYTINNGLKSLNIQALAVLDDTLYVGTYYAHQSGGIGIWKRALDTLHLGITEKYTDDKIQIFPNPVSKSVTLRSKNPFHNATLRLYNNTGQVEKEIRNINGNTFILDRNNLPAGIYFILLIEEDNIVATQKLIITE